MITNKVHAKVANQVFAFCLVEGPKKSWDLRRAFYGEAYAKSSSNNAAYNRSRQNAEQEGVILKDTSTGLYTLGEEGKALIKVADELHIDLSLVKTDARRNFEAKQQS